jgi:hypothetical protein
MGQKNEEITFEYIYPDFYNPIYVNGLEGGITCQKELIVHFFLERPPLPSSVTCEINPEGRPVREVSTLPKDLERKMVRYVRPSIILSPEQAKAFYLWLGRQIEELDSIENPSTVD